MNIQRFSFLNESSCVYIKVYSLKMIINHDSLNSTCFSNTQHLHILLENNPAVTQSHRSSNFRNFRHYCYTIWIIESFRDTCCCMTQSFIQLFFKRPTFVFVCTDNLRFFRTSNRCSVVDFGKFIDSAVWRCYFSCVTKSKGKIS